MNLEPEEDTLFVDFVSAVAYGALAVVGGVGFAVFTVWYFDL